MSDIYIPGITSRLDSGRLIEDIMKLERVPRERAVSNRDRIETERSYWQGVSRHTSALQESARHLFSFQNPFNNSVVRSADESVITATAARDATEQDRSFTVKQIAQADRFLSAPQEQNYRVENGNYTFYVGNEEISFEFRGGTLRDFADTLNRRGRDMIQASLIAVRPGTNSLIIESKLAGEENRLAFAASASILGEEIGMIGPVDSSNQEDRSTRPLNAVSTARDSIISMDGIEISRSGNEINDLIPGLTIYLRESSDKPFRLQVIPDRESVKDAVISFVGNYNRLMAEINILTRSDPRIIDELTYLSREERDDALQRLGAFAGDSTLMQMRNNLSRIMSTPVLTSEEQDLSLLAHIGISGGRGGTDPSRLRGYLDIDERVLDAALATRLPAIRQLFGNDTDGDLLVDSGVAFAVDSLTRPYIDRTGLLAQKTNGMDSRIAQETRRIETFDRQLSVREAELKRQFSQMEGAYSRMEQMSSSLERFQQQNNNNR